MGLSVAGRPRTVHSLGDAGLRTPALMARGNLVCLVSTPYAVPPEARGLQRWPVDLAPEGSGLSPPGSLRSPERVPLGTHAGLLGTGMRNYYSGFRCAYIRLPEPGSPCTGNRTLCPYLEAKGTLLCFKISRPPRPGRAARTKSKLPGRLRTRTGLAVRVGSPRAQGRKHYALCAARREPRHVRPGRKISPG